MSEVLDRLKVEWDDIQPEIDRLDPGRPPADWDALSARFTDLSQRTAAAAHEWFDVSKQRRRRVAEELGG